MIDLWMPEDIERALRAAELACKATARALEHNGISGPEAEAYLHGYRDALAVVAASFGIEHEDRKPLAVPALTAHRHEPVIWG